MRKGLVGSLALDTSSLLELLFSTPHGIKLKEALKSEEAHGNVSTISIAELKYVLCRKLGVEEATIRVRSLLESGYVVMHDDSELVEYAAEYKCRRRLSLADCFTLALARKINIPALFARREEELVKEASREPFDVEILFLEDF
ncbi:MAG: PIN domain-containing protein [Thermoproteota archaeon]|nr:PIN domain-containing protein [Candidatus Brockarchaeota archaeon]